MTTPIHVKEGVISVTTMVRPHHHRYLMFLIVSGGEVQSTTGLSNEWKRVCS